MLFLLFFPLFFFRHFSFSLPPPPCPPLPPPPPTVLLLLYSCPLVSLVALRRSGERTVPAIHPSERTVASRSSRDQRDTRPRVTRVTSTRGGFFFFFLFYYFVPLFAPCESALAYNRRFNFIKFFSLNKHVLSV